MKRFYKIFASWFLCLFLVLSQFIVSFADVKSLMISSGSNALMTLELDDSDYLIMSPRSSIDTVINTVDYSGVNAILYFKYRSNDSHAYNRYCTLDSDGSFYGYGLDDSVYLHRVTFYLSSSALPMPGNYYMSFDYSSDFSCEYWDSCDIYSIKAYENALPIQDTFSVYISQNSGDFYKSPIGISMGNLSNMQLSVFLKSSDIVNYGGTFSLNFTKTNDSPSYGTAGSGNISQDYDENVSSSLSDISSSVNTMTEEISGVTEAIQNLQGAMEPHYSNVLTQLHHITEQLHAFYDQVYNNIHLPELSMLTQIKEAIENIDLQIEVDISEVKTAINNMSTAVQNKLQSTTDQITGGYDNSGMTQENEKLEQSINQYDEVESGIFEDAEGFIGDFEYPSVESLPFGVIKALAFVGSFLQGIFLCMGEFSVIITFSLTMIFVMVVVGYHRIRS